jgi:uncharacterized protein (DUF2141 family)
MGLEVKMRMRRVFFLSFMTLFVLFEFLCDGAVYSSPDQTGTITVQLTGFAHDQGTARLCVCRSEDEYNGKTNVFRIASAAVRNRKSEWVFENMPYGAYSIKVFHDENGNSRLDTSFLGKPVERYGFSNNADGCFGPPPFSSTVFALESPMMKISIAVQ